MRISRSRVLMLLAGIALATSIGFSAAPVVAQSSLPTLLDSCATTTFDPNAKDAAGNPIVGGKNVTPGLDCVLKQFLRVAKFILAITGSVALVIFVYTGFMYILYSSQSDKAKKYTEGLQGAVIGIVIIFCSGIAVQYFDRAIRGKDDSGCAAQGSDYACANWGGNGVQCITGLCKSDPSPSFKCCKPNTPENLNAACVGSRGVAYSCMDSTKSTAFDCDGSSNLCPDGPGGNAQCCTTKEKFEQAFGPQESSDDACVKAKGAGFTCMDPIRGNGCVSGLCAVPFQQCCTAQACDCTCVDGTRPGTTDTETECSNRCGAPGLGFCR
jgi:hypothetical protein